MSLRSDRLALEFRRARRPLVLMLLMVVGAVGGGFYLFSQQLVQWPWDSTREFKVAFDDVKGVRAGQQEVRVAGVKVGLISKSEVEGDHAVLTLSVERTFGELYKNARLRLRPVTALQDMYVAVDSRGTKAAGVLGKDDVLERQRTETPVDVARILNTFDPDVRSRLAVLLEDTGAAFGSNGDQLRRSFVALAPFLRNAQRLTGTLATRRTALARVVHNLGSVTAALSTRDRELSRLVDVGNRTVVELAVHDGTLSRTLAELPATLTSMRSAFGALRSAQTELDPALRSLLPVAQRLAPGLDALKEVSDDADPALAALKPAFRRLRPLARDLQPTSTALRDSLTQLAPIAPRVDRATQKVVPCELAIGKFFQWTSSVLKFYDAGGAWLRGELVFGVPGITAGRGKDPVLRRSWTCTQGGPKK